MRGFTLVETIITIVVIAIVAAVGAVSLTETARAWSLASRFQDNAVANAMVVANRMSREIRRLKNDSSVLVASVSQFRFIDLSNLTITYDLSGTTLNRTQGTGVSAITDALADNVSSLNYTYYDDNGALIATVPIVNPNNTDIRRVKVDFSLLAGANTLSFSFSVCPRNLRKKADRFP
jgi:prepilin-type N-terminal cleavage/methylation domain-containing protein